MFGFKWKHRTIIVEVFEAGAEKPFWRTVLPIEELPDTFEIRTTLNIKGEDWQVAQASPAIKEEFRLKGSLQIVVYKPQIGRMPVGDILFSLPTISDDIAGIEHSPSLENVFVVREDDWRQEELISRDHADKIADEIEGIRQIYENEKDGHGFRKLHVRSAIPRPLEGIHLTLPELMTKFDLEHVYRGVAFDNCAAVIQRGFAFRTAHSEVVWGQLDERDELAIVCITLLASFTPDQRSGY
ncbi:MAG TPA: hypothetical protein VHU84_10315, partial [Lacipirellulaceae bacterium]|nr:hypothetical protein [Lacipirellulaceae bacterium]